MNIYHAISKLHEILRISIFLFPKHRLTSINSQKGLLFTPLPLILERMSISLSLPFMITALCQ